jgi:uncharacterized protein YcfJ
MRPIVILAALAVTAAPAAGHAACSKRTTGTVVGAVTGGLLGHAIAGRGSHTEGTLLGAAAGGLVGNQVSKCRTARRAYYRAPAPRRAQPAYARAATCRYETRSYYDAYGQMVYAPTRVCGS